jgi:hypothetical protein
LSDAMYEPLAIAVVPARWLFDTLRKAVAMSRSSSSSSSSSCGGAPQSLTAYTTLNAHVTRWRAAAAAATGSDSVRLLVAVTGASDASAAAHAQYVAEQARRDKEARAAAEDAADADDGDFAALDGDDIGLRSPPARRKRPRFRLDDATRAAYAVRVKPEGLRDLAAHMYGLAGLEMHFLVSGGPAGAP